MPSPMTTAIAIETASSIRGGGARLEPRSKLSFPRSNSGCYDREKPIVRHDRSTANYLRPFFRSRVALASKQSQPRDISLPH
jgi:hypothetical protein